VGVRACFKETGAGEDSGALSVLALGGGGKEELVVVVSGDLRHYISTIDIMSSCRVAGVFCGDNVPSLDSHMSVALLSLLLSLVVIAVFPPARPAVWRSPHSSAYTYLGVSISLLLSPPWLEFVVLAVVARSADPERATAVVCAGFFDRYVGGMLFQEYIEEVKRMCEQAIQELGGVIALCPTVKPLFRHVAVNGTPERSLKIMCII